MKTKLIRLLLKCEQGVMVGGGAWGGGSGVLSPIYVGDEVGGGVFMYMHMHAHVHRHCEHVSICAFTVQ